MLTFKLTTSLFTFILCTILSTGVARAGDVPPILGSYDNVITGTNNGEQLYNWGNTSDHLIG